MTRHMPKICCLGFQKTGTTSLKVALERLGYSVGEAYDTLNETLDPESADADSVVERAALDVLSRHDAIQDSPSAFVFEAFDKAFPGSKFILTSRSSEAWFKSFSGYFPNEHAPLRRWMYKCDRIEGHKQSHIDIYDRQNARIREYFRDRPADFIEIDLSKGDGWYELVNFLGKDLLPPFPHANKAKPAVREKARGPKLGRELKSIFQAKKNR